MLKVKLNAQNKRFTILIPYVFIKLACLVITTKWIVRLINKSIKKGGKKFVIPEFKRKDLSPLLREISKHRGVTLLELKASDGTEVKIML